jgi:glycerol uptake facilitator-like aquaporin
MATLGRRLAAECFGTAGLLCVVVGSGIMAQRLAGDQAAIALLCNTLATVLGLWVLIEVIGPCSGAHFNPVVSTVMALKGRLPWSEAALYGVCQLLGAILGSAVAHIMFDLPLWSLSQTVRDGQGQLVAEFIATLGLLLVILFARPDRVPALVAAFIGAAYWFTSSTSFANPAAVVGRMLTDTYAGIAPTSAGWFVSAQFAGGLVALALTAKRP